MSYYNYFSITEALGAANEINAANKRYDREKYVEFIKRASIFQAQQERRGYANLNQIDRAITKAQDMLDKIDCKV